MIIKTDKRTAFVAEFSSVSEYGAYLESLGEKRAKGAQRQSEGNESSKRWDLNTDYYDALRIALDGGRWEKGAADLQKIEIDGFEASQYATDINMNNNVVGGAVDIGAYLDNDPECFYYVEEQQSSKPIIKLAMDTGASCGVNSKNIMNRNRAVMALIEALEMNGYSVQLTAVSSFTRPDNHVRFEVIVKQAGEAWSAASVAFAMAHPAFTRRLGFRACESAPVELAEMLTNSAYGTGDIPRTEPIEADIYIPWLDSRTEKSCKTPEDALDWTFKYIQRNYPELAPKRAA